MEYRLVSFNLCPFVQRSVITLKEKGVPFEIEYIDLQNPPDWFKEMSPLGNVPVLQVGTEVLFESAVINEFIDESTAGHLHPEDALLRAKNRAWIEFVSQCIVASYRLYTTADPVKRKELSKDLDDKLQRLEQQVVGPLFNGAEFCLVDAAAAPMLQRLVWVQELLPNTDILGRHSALQSWYQALFSRDSVTTSIVPEANSLFRDMLITRGILGSQPANM